MEQTRPGYGTVRRQYKRTLAQRNSLLKQHAALSQTALFPWDVRLSQLAGQIVRARSELAELLNNQIGSLYRELSGSTATTVEVLYQAPWLADSYETWLLKKLELDRELDRLRGFTGSGPHREDFTVRFNDRAASETASRGETRTAILALKILELGLIEQVRQQKPLLLLDDVFSELDGKRRHALTDHLASHQTFITTTDADVVLQHFTDHTNIIAVA